MLIAFDRETMPDELYNMLLQHFVNEAVAQGYPVNKNTNFDQWVIQCKVSQPNLH